MLDELDYRSQTMQNLLQSFSEAGVNEKRVVVFHRRKLFVASPVEEARPVLLKESVA